MEIKFLGTGSKGGIPQSDCMMCRTCKAAIERGGHNRRSRSSIAIKNGEKYTLIDATPDLRYQLTRENIPMTLISEILLTHTHYDHIFGLFETSVGRKLEIPVYSTKNILDLIFGEGKTFNYLVQQEWVANLEIKTGEKTKINNFEFLAFEVAHTPVQILGSTLGYKISENGKNLTYIPDIAELTANTIEYIDNSDVLILDGTFYETPKHNHIAIKPTILILENKKLNIGKVYFTHINHTEPLHEELVDLVGLGRYDIAFDGMSIKL